MRYHINHTTTYRYSQPVTLQPHVVRLCPRSDATQTLLYFALTTTPVPLQQSTITDLDSSTVIKLWFKPELMIEQFQIQVISEVETYRKNPFDYLLEPWATYLPIDYPTSLLTQLQPYLQTQSLSFCSGLDPIAIQLAQEIHQKVDGDTTNFLVMLNQEIYQNCEYRIRETGHPWPPGITWSQRQGSCRDLTVLFIEVCRAAGLAARFVSGYQEGDPESAERHLHAWAEVYLPGGGWRGFDPTHGLAVADRHIALVTSASSHYTSPVSGSLKQTNGVKSSMTYQLTIQELPSLT